MQLCLDVGLTLDNFQNTDYDRICDEINTNLSSPIRMVQTFLPHLMKKHHAAILNVTSGLAYINYAEAPIYSASKAGLHAYCKTLREQLKDTSVKVSELAPPKTSRPLISRDNPNAGNNKVPTMDIPDVVSAMIRGMHRDTYLRDQPRPEQGPQAGRKISALRAGQRIRRNGSELHQDSPSEEHRRGTSPRQTNQKARTVLKDSLVSLTDQSHRSA